MTSLLQMVMDTLNQHLPESAEWAPAAGMAALAVFGLVLLVRGAKLSRALTTIAMGGAAAVGGVAIAKAVDLSLAPSAGIAGVIGLIVGWAFFRFWLAMLLGVAFSAGGLSFYYVKDLDRPVHEFMSKGLATADVGSSAELLITLPEKGAAASNNNAGAELVALWNYLSANVHNFQLNFSAIALAAGLAGVLLGWLLPRTARAIWAASLGTVSLMLGLCGLLDAYAPKLLAQLQTLGSWTWGIVAAVWLFSLIYNVVNTRPKRAAVDPDAEGAPAAA